MTPEQVDALITALRTPQASHEAVLLSVGAAAASGLVLLVWLIISFRMKPVDKLADKLDEVCKGINEIKLEQATVKEKLWSGDEVDQAITNKINIHTLNCPYHNKK